MLRWDEPTGTVGVFRAPAGNSNGNTVDRAGPAGHLRARQPARHPHRARRLDHRARRPLRGQAPQQPQRRRRAVRRLDLVHRPGLRHRQRLRGPPRRPARSARCHVYRVDPSGGDAGSSPTTSCARTASPSRPTSAGCTSPTPAPTRRPRTSASFDVGDDGDAVRRRRVRRVHRRRASTASASTTTGGSGRAPATACTASTPTAR